MKHRKIGAIMMGLLLGVTVPFGAMLLETRSAEATILVFDQRNVEEAIKEAVQTAKILTTEQKELALKILNMKSLDPRALLGFLQQQMEAAQVNRQGDICQTPEILAQMGKSTSILNLNTTAQHVLQNEIGTIESVIDGDATLVDLYKQSMKNRKALDATYQAAAQAAQNAQASDGIALASVREAQAQANNAQGQKQVMQAEAGILSALSTQTNTTNVLLSNIAGVIVEDAYVRNYEKAQGARLEHDYQQGLSDFADGL